MTLQVSTKAKAKALLDELCATRGALEEVERLQQTSETVTVMLAGQARHIESHI